MTLGKPVLPKEHGIWVVLLAPLFIGSFAVHPSDGYKVAGVIFFTFCSLFAAFALEPVKFLAKPAAGMDRKRIAGWLMIYSIGAVACLSVIVVSLDRWGLLWLAPLGALMVAARAWASAARALRELWVESLGVFGIALTAPAAAYIQHGRVIPESIFIYLLCVIWFYDRLMTARKTLKWARTGANLPKVLDRVGWYKNELLIHAASLTLAALVIFLSGGLAPWSAFAPFLLATGKNAVDVLFVSRLPGPMRIGFTEMGLGIAFALFEVAAWLAA